MSILITPTEPGGVLWVYFTGIALLAAAVGIFIPRIAFLTCVLYALMLLGFVVMLHIPGMGASDPMMKMMAMTSMFKDIGLAGGALFIGAYFKERS